MNKNQDFDQARVRAAQLRELIERSNQQYYDEDAPELEDSEYDALTRELRALEEVFPQLISEDSPTQRVGGTAQAKFSAVTHEVKMESLLDVFSKDEVIDFCERVLEEYPDVHFVVEPKIDGLSVSLEYDNGVLVRGSTRGDGVSGEDVTENLTTVESIPHSFTDAPEYIEVRGEVYMPRAAFAALNEQQESAGLRAFKNPRNAAAGSLRQKNARITAQRNLDVFIFNVQRVRGVQFDSHSASLDYLRERGFSVIPSYRVCKNVHEVLGEIDNIGSSRHNLSFDTDGAVIKIDSLDLRHTMGSTSKFPRWAVAFKYPPEQAETTVRDIEITVGRTGVLTPTGVFDPVQLAGTTVSRASLHNEEYIASKDIRVGDRVILRKAGEIIPEVVAVASHGSGTVPYEMPKRCPSCGEAVCHIQDEAAVRCVNLRCPAQLLRNVIHFASRDAMDIEGLGPAVAEQLVESGMIESPLDLYELRTDMIEKLERMGALSASNLIGQIEKSRSNELYRLIFALGIRHIGVSASRLLCDRFGSLAGIAAASVEDMAAIDGFGDIMAKSVFDFFALDSSKQLIERVNQYQINTVSQQKVLNGTQLEGKTIVVTGTLPTLSRTQAEELIKAHGGKTSGSVSKKTSMVLAGENAGSKLLKANELGIEIITEEQLQELIKS